MQKMLCSFGVRKPWLAPAVKPRKIFTQKCCNVYLQNTTLLSTNVVILDLCIVGELFDPKTLQNTILTYLRHMLYQHWIFALVGGIFTQNIAKYRAKFEQRMSKLEILQHIMQNNISLTTSVLHNIGYLSWKNIQNKSVAKYPTKYYFA